MNMKSFCAAYFDIRQTSSVSEYVDQFTSLVDQLTAYASHLDPVYYTQRFIDGLRDEFKSTILFQRPTLLDTACVLAQLQEKVVASTAQRTFRRPEMPSSSRQSLPRGTSITSTTS